MVFLVDVFLISMRVHITKSRGSWNEHRERTQFLEQLQIEHTKVIQRGGVDVGFVALLDRAPDVEMQTLCIAPDHQRHGLGTAVTRQVIEECRRHGYGLVLSVLKANIKARALYERLGFVLTQESQHHYRMRLVS